MTPVYLTKCFKAVVSLCQWFFLACCVGAIAGVGSAVLLTALNGATGWREAHRWAIALLPLAGWVSGWIYDRWGKSVEAGNNLLLEEIHHPTAVIPLRMAPLILLGTTLTHLFGGSAGREGTALQIAASLADSLTRVFRLNSSDRQILLMASLSGGVASVFGTPLAGTIFGLEVLTIGRIHHGALFPCLMAAMVGDRVTVSLGLHHTVYRHAASIPVLTPVTLMSAIAAGIMFGWTAMAFVTLTHHITGFFKSRIVYAPERTAIGGLIVAGIMMTIGTTTYSGLGIATIVRAFEEPLPPWDFVGKLGLTALTIGSGFKGGEVTPLFFIGATLGNALSSVLALPLPLLVGMGFVAVFAGAANTPIAATLMGIELFGAESGVFMAIACVMSYLCSGQAGIYRSQRIEEFGKYPF